jgi:hypothetical protein
VEAATGDADGDGLSLEEAVGSGVAVGSGFCRQIGTFGLIVGVGATGSGLGVGGNVGTGWGGTRGSGNRGSDAAESVSERFQSGPYGPDEAYGSGVTTAAIDGRACSVA